MVEDSRPPRLVARPWAQAADALSIPTEPKESTSEPLKKEVKMAEEAKQPAPDWDAERTQLLLDILHMLVEVPNLPYIRQAVSDELAGIDTSLKEQLTPQTEPVEELEDA